MLIIFHWKMIKKNHEKACFKNYTLKSTYELFFVFFNTDFLQQNQLLSHGGSHSHHLVISLLPTLLRTWPQQGQQLLIQGSTQSAWVTAVPESVPSCHSHSTSPEERKASGICSPALTPVGPTGTLNEEQLGACLPPLRHVLTHAISFFSHKMLLDPHLEEVLIKLRK